jgi:hypothetical protein
VCVCVCVCVPLAFGSLAIVEGPGLWSAAQARERRLIEDPLQDLVPSSHPFVAHPLARVGGRWDKTRVVGGEPIGTLESSDVAYTDQELCPEDRSHARQANEDPSLGTSEKTLL